MKEFLKDAAHGVLAVVGSAAVAGGYFGLIAVFGYHTFAVLA